ncbi:MAG: NAD(P)H-binding protein [Phycisphaerae bacterium]
METTEWNVVTGAFSYTGTYIARKLLATGKNVRTLTNHPNRPDSFVGQVNVLPLNFQNPTELAASLRGTTVLYNTYWIRFEHGGLTFDKAVANTEILIQAAREAGIKRIVHISVTNPSIKSPLPYFKGKARVEEIIMRSGLTYAIIRPTVIFGLGDILINNIAWMLRHFPVFIIPGSGEYQLQPVFAEDVADMAIEAGDSDQNMVIDAVGPEIFTFYGLVNLIAEKIASNAMIFHLPPVVALGLIRSMGYMVRDVVLTADELKGLAANLLVSANPPTGKTRFSDWLERNAEKIGIKYSSEIKRHY